MCVYCVTVKMHEIKSGTNSIYMIKSTLFRKKYSLLRIYWYHSINFEELVMAIFFAYWYQSWKSRTRIISDLWWYYKYVWYTFICTYVTPSTRNANHSDSINDDISGKMKFVFYLKISQLSRCHSRHYIDFIARALWLWKERIVRLKIRLRYTCINKNSTIIVHFNFNDGTVIDLHIWGGI